MFGACSTELIRSVPKGLTNLSLSRTSSVKQVSRNREIEIVI